MPHIPFTKAHQEHPHRDPESIQAYLVGGGIASLAAAVHLIQDAKVPAKNIHILESLPVMGGSMDGNGDPSSGYLVRGGRMLNFSYNCTYELLKRVPSLEDEEKTVYQEIQDFNAKKENQTHSKARLISSVADQAQKDDRAIILETSKLGLDMSSRLDLIKMALETEHQLGAKRIDECFPASFFQTKFWFMWATTFAFQPWHSAVEFRRYLHRFMHEFHRISTLEGVDRTPYNQYDSIVRPVEKYLEKQGVDFRFNTRVTDIDFISGIPTTASELHMLTNNTPMTAQLDPQDIVIITLGSMTSNSSVGSNDSPPPPVVDEALQDGSWDLWAKLAAKDPAFGNPSTFTTRIQESEWESFTVTLSDPEFLRRIEGFSRNEPGTGALMTFKDSAWLLSIVIPHQPHFVDQPLGIDVFWGYGLFPDREGNFVKKPMRECSGMEILQELLGHLHFPAANIVENAIVRPCLMPYITSQFLTRKEGDRPAVVPKGSTNVACVGQFVEVPEDTVFTVEYSVRTAQMAVFELMGLDLKPKAVYKGERHLGILAETLMKLMT